MHVHAFTSCVTFACTCIYLFCVVGLNMHLNACTFATDMHALHASCMHCMQVACTACKLHALHAYPCFRDLRYACTGAITIVHGCSKHMHAQMHFRGCLRGVMLLSVRVVTCPAGGRLGGVSPRVDWLTLPLFRVVEARL